MYTMAHILLVCAGGVQAVMYIVTILSLLTLPRASVAWNVAQPAQRHLHQGFSGFRTRGQDVELDSGVLQSGRVGARRLLLMPELYRQREIEEMLTSGLGGEGRFPRGSRQLDFTRTLRSHSPAFIIPSFQKSESYRMSLMPKGQEDRTICRLVF